MYLHARIEGRFARYGHAREMYLQVFRIALGIEALLARRAAVAADVALFFALRDLRADRGAAGGVASVAASLRPMLEHVGGRVEDIDEVWFALRTEASGGVDPRFGRAIAAQDRKSVV